MKKIIIALLCIVHCALCIDLVAQNDREAERRVKSVVSVLKHSSYEGRFTLSYYNSQEETTDEQLGDILIKGSCFRIKLGENETVFNGKTQWVFLSKYNEVSITEPTKEELCEVNPLSMIEYYVAKDKISLGDNGVINFYPLNPKECEYFRVELSLDKSNTPKRLVIYQKNGDKITLLLESLKKININDSVFNFDASKYPNVEINDLR